MKRVSGTKKIKKKRNNKSNGFTLVELLAVIAILSIVMTIGIYVATNIIDAAKEKSYKVTINNVEQQASNYVIEGLASTIWMDGRNTTYQYQCVTVQNLIEAGYFKSDVLDSYISKDRKVQSTDTVYLERDANSKTITKHVFLVDNKYSGLCNDFNTDGKISYDVNPSGWSKEKNITIKYNIYNIDNVSNYNYQYTYYSVDLTKQFLSPTGKYELSVDKNGTLYAYIKHKDGTALVSSSLVIDKIDNVDPTGSITSKNNVASKQTVTLTLTDNESGVSEYYFGKDNPNSSEVEWTKVAVSRSVEVTKEVDSSGTWYLAIKDVVGNMTVISKAFYKTTLNVSNASVNPNTIITMEGDKFTVPIPIASSYYTFSGWYAYSNYAGSVITEYTPSSSKTLYGKTTENKLVGGKVQIIKTASAENTLEARITEDTTPKADKYSYQWYTNTSASITGGTKINGATSKTLALTSVYDGKYIYVMVTATKSNYRSTSFGNVYSEKISIAKTYTITFIANGGYSSSALAYDYNPTSESNYCNYASSGDHDVTGTMAIQTCTVGESCKLNKNQYSRQCNLFKGWTTSSDEIYKNFSGVITSSSDNSTDSLYIDEDTLINNGTNNITLYAVWQSNHNFTAIGNQLFQGPTGDTQCGSGSEACGSQFHCDYYITEAYASYCTECGMSASHYNYCYKLPDEYEERKPTMVCPVHVSFTLSDGSARVQVDDNGYFGFGTSKVDVAQSRLKVHQHGGIIEGKEPFDKVTSKHQTCVTHYQLVSSDPKKYTEFDTSEFTMCK